MALAHNNPVIPRDVAILAPTEALQLLQDYVPLEAAATAPKRQILISENQFNFLHNASIPAASDSSHIPSAPRPGLPAPASSSNIDSTTTSNLVTSERPPALSNAVMVSPEPPTITSANQPPHTVMSQPIAPDNTPATSAQPEHRRSSRPSTAPRRTDL
jgi:hypothetical protein